VPCERTDGQVDKHGEANIRFSQIANETKTMAGVYKGGDTLSSRHVTIVCPRPNAHTSTNLSFVVTAVAEILLRILIDSIGTDLVDARNPLS
jgi:hypothetical protein